jgi:hypothetical protein
LICNQKVAGSSPAVGTSKIKGLREFHVTPCALRFALSEGM